MQRRGVRALDYRSLCPGFEFQSAWMPVFVFVLLLLTYHLHHIRGGDNDEEINERNKQNQECLSNLVVRFSSIPYGRSQVFRILKKVIVLKKFDSLVILRRIPDIGLYLYLKMYRSNNADKRSF